MLFPVREEGDLGPIGKRARIRAAVDVMRRRRPGVLEIEAEKRASRRTDNLSLAGANGSPTE